MKFFSSIAHLIDFVYMFFKNHLGHLSGRQAVSEVGNGKQCGRRRGPRPHWRTRGPQRAASVREESARTPALTS